MGIINLFVLPMIAVYGIYKLCGKALAFNAEFASIYGICTTMIAFITEVVLFIIRFLFKLAYINYYSTYYMLVAIIVAVIIPLIVKNVKIIINKD